MPKLESGRLRHLIEIQSEVIAQDETTGVITKSWKTFEKVWAAVEPLSAREFIAAAGVQSKVTARIVIRSLSWVVPSMRIIHGDHVYNVEAVLADPSSGSEYLTLPVSEVVNG